MTELRGVVVALILDRTQRAVNRFLLASKGLHCQCRVTGIYHEVLSDQASPGLSTFSVQRPFSISVWLLVPGVFRHRFLQLSHLAIAHCSRVAAPSDVDGKGHIGQDRAPGE